LNYLIKQEIASALATLGLAMTFVRWRKIIEQIISSGQARIWRSAVEQVVMLHILALQVSP
jgi:hypothetical protein